MSRIYVKQGRNILQKANVKTKKIKHGWNILQKIYLAYFLNPLSSYPMTCRQVQSEWSSSQYLMLYFLYIQPDACYILSPRVHINS